MNHVIHYHLPTKESEFIHRNGRTARMHASGTAYIIQFKDDKTPDYIPDDIGVLKVTEGRPLPDRPEYQTIYISGGRKNKINRIDIVGFFSVDYTYNNHKRMLHTARQIDELDGNNQYHDRGVLSMAHAGRDTGGSQFFICHSRDNTAHLDRHHTCFAKVYEGVEVIDKIRGSDEIEKILIFED